MNTDESILEEYRKITQKTCTTCKGKGVRMKTHPVYQQVPCHCQIEIETKPTIQQGIK